MKHAECYVNQQVTFTTKYGDVVVGDVIEIHQPDEYSSQPYAVVLVREGAFGPHSDAAGVNCMVRIEHLQPTKED